MKSEFILAFNEIAEMRKLPREVIVEALQAALVSAYRRSTGASSGQRIEARLDEKTGEPSIWVEKEVTEEVHSELTEISLSEARAIDPNATIGKMIMTKVERTPRDFGRIAAQTAKQVILQRMREAERDAQYQEYMERVGDLVSGTVQSISGGVVTVGLGRTEAILPPGQQMPGERYRIHDKVRAYVMEVRKSPRGPQIVLSRTHRNMLRRLLEYEVPEIYNGIVEIKSIAREPGARSKVAVAARQEGADPVGACVGMKGVRIQSIVKELNNEKIDVIEWNPDQAVFISKALSPARVSDVFLDDDPDAGRTAIVVVPDDQLSLAIGREGQNARLVAKLTGWRIDIKSTTEATEDALAYLKRPEFTGWAEQNATLIEQIRQIMEKKAANRLLMPEDYQLMVKFVDLVETYRLSLAESERAERRALRQAARAMVPAAAYDLSLEDTSLPHRIYDVLADGGYLSVGAVMEQYYLDPKQFLNLRGFNPAMLDDIRRLVEEAQQAPAAEEAPAPVEVSEPVAAIKLEETPVEPMTGLETEPELEIVEEPVPEEPVRAGSRELSEADELARARRAALVAQLLAEESGSQAVMEQPSGEEVKAEPVPEKQAPEMIVRPSPPERELAKASETDFGFDEDEEEEEERKAKPSRRSKQRRRELIYDEELGRVVVKRRRKGRRSRGFWDEYEE